MNRNILLGVLVGILLVALFWFLFYQPRNTELAELRDETERLEAQERQVAQRVRQLEGVREAAPAFEAELAAANLLVPREPGLPAILRQLQLAADESGMTLLSVSPSRPAPVTVEGGGDSVHRINVALSLEGTYFQTVDFLRRIEDPTITPRALLWNTISIGGEPAEHPLLGISLQGDLFAILPVAPAEPAQPETTPDDQTDTTPDDQTDTDVDEGDEATENEQ